MVELPRAEVDFIIDGLSERAKNLLIHHNRLLGSMKPIELFDVETAEELEAAGLLMPHGSDESLPLLWEPTVNGGLASEKLKCGMYDHHKAIYAARDARDAQIEAIPGYATF